MVQSLSRSEDGSSQFSWIITHNWSFPISTITFHPRSHWSPLICPIIASDLHLLLTDRLAGRRWGAKSAKLHEIWANQPLVCPPTLLRQRWICMGKFWEQRRDICYQHSSDEYVQGIYFVNMWKGKCRNTGQDNPPSKDLYLGSWRTCVRERGKGSIQSQYEPQIRDPGIRLNATTDNL